jgi:repressor LexA
MKKEFAMPRKSKGLRERHEKILKFLEVFSNDNGYPPSIRQICKATDISSTSVVNYYLDQLEEWKYIERDRNISRGVRLLKTAAGDVYSQIRDKVEVVKQTIDEVLKVPVMGRIGASYPVAMPTGDFSYYDAESMVEVARSLIPSRDENSLFALEVDGDSMIDAMVNDGDIVIMKPVQEVKNGEMVAVWLEDRDETTLKYFYKEKNRVRLQPANPTMEPIYISNEQVNVQGKVVMVIRQLSAA